MRVGTRFGIAFSIVAIWAFTPAAAVIYDVPTDEALLEVAPVVVYGQVEHVAVGPLWTDATVRIGRVLKGGVAGAAILVRQLGGFDPATGRGTSFMGLRMLREGEKVMLFLDRDPDGVYWTVDLGMGTFFEDREGYLSRHEIDELYRHAERFGQWIADRSAGLEPAANYFMDEIPGPHRVTEAATWIRDRYCGKTNLRDNRFDKQTGKCYLDRDGDGYYAWYDELFRDTNGNGQWDYAEPYVDADGNGEYTPAEWWHDENGNGAWDDGEILRDENNNGRWDAAETYTDTNGNGEWDDAEPYVDWNDNGQYDIAEVEVDCVPADYEGSKQLYDSSGHFYYVDADGSGHYNPDPAENPDEVIVTGDNIDFHYLRWPDWDQKVTSTSVVEGNSSRVAAVNAAIGLWNGDAGSSVAIPAAVEEVYVGDRPAIVENRIHVDFDVTDLCSLNADWHDNLRVWMPACSSPLARTLVVWVCNSDPETTTFHDIPGGSGSAYRIGLSRIWLSPKAIDERDPDKLGHVLAHEFGHVLGIHDADDGDGVDDIMDPQWTTSLTALSADDRMAVRKLYPPQSSGFGGGPGGGGPSPAEDPPPTEDPAVPPPVPPTAGFDADAVVQDEAEDLWRARSGEAVRFVSTSTGAVASVHWDFGDGTTSRRSTVDHVWQRPGFYDVVLTVSGAGSESSVARTYLVEAGEPRGTCVAGPETICLQDARYEVSVEWRTSEGESGAGRVVHAGTNDSGMFSFFGRDNWEILVKVLNGCSINGHHWVYAASATDLGYAIRVVDTATGDMREYGNEAGRVASAVADETAFSSLCETPAAASGRPLPSGGETLLLDDGRFEVRVEWSTADDRGVARTVRPRTGDSGLFWFFDPANWEVLVKVLDGCGVNGHHWVYAASATSLPLELTVTDTETGEVRRYEVSPGADTAIADPAAFADSCRPAR